MTSLWNKLNKRLIPLEFPKERMRPLIKWNLFEGSIATRKCILCTVQANQQIYNAALKTPSAANTRLCMWSSDGMASFARTDDLHLQTTSAGSSNCSSRSASAYQFQLFQMFLLFYSCIRRSDSKNSVCIPSMWTVQPDQDLMLQRVLIQKIKNIARSDAPRQ
jgi:hypothetical protein